MEDVGARLHFLLIKILPMYTVLFCLVSQYLCTHLQIATYTRWPSILSTFLLLTVPSLRKEILPMYTFNSNCNIFYQAREASRNYSVYILFRLSYNKLCLIKFMCWVCVWINALYNIKWPPITLLQIVAYVSIPKLCLSM